MNARRLIPPVLRQLAGDPYGLGRAAQSVRSEQLVPRTRTADKVVQSICPYCAVGCGQKVYVKDEKVIQIEGDPDPPISRGRLCPKGSASEKLVNSPMLRAGVQSASDPKYVVGPQRAQINRGERAGAARRKPNVHGVRQQKGSPATAPVELSAQ